MLARQKQRSICFCLHFSLLLSLLQAKESGEHFITRRSDAEQPKPNNLKWKNKKQTENENKLAEKTSTQ